jgi:hypothetical protein
MIDEVISQAHEDEGSQDIDRFLHKGSADEILKVELNGLEAFCKAALGEPEPLLAIEA